MSALTLIIISGTPLWDHYPQIRLAKIRIKIGVNKNVNKNFLFM